MIRALSAWLDDRTGISGVLHETLYERIPGGARWRYVWGSTLVCAFVTQVVTGIFLWMAYSPSSQTAWESVYYIQHEMGGGWLLRGVHHFMAQAMVVLLALHLLQVVIDGAYRAPREINFWLGLILMQIVLGLSLTGYLLPWDQKGYWATNVATNLMTLVPVVGEHLQRLVVGGPNYGHHTLTRFFALHAGVLPGLLVAFLALHIALFRRHGIKTPNDEGPDVYFWPDQILRDAVACLAVLAVVLLLAIRWDVVGVLTGNIDPTEVGADLYAPADPSESYAAARPEWYFLFLFEMLKPEYFKSELVGAIVVPACVFGFLFLMPLIGHWDFGHRFNVLFICTLLLAGTFLTWRAYRGDRLASGDAELVENKYPDEVRQADYEKRFRASRDYLAARESAEVEAKRIKQFVAHRGGIPPTGAITLLRDDSEIQGPKLYRRYCASCHNYLDPEGAGIASESSSAPNLYGFANRAWIERLLNPDYVASVEYFGDTAHVNGDMVNFVQDSLADLGDEDRSQLNDLVAALSAEAELVEQRELDADTGKIERGTEALVDLSCTDCHRFHDEGELGMAPDLTGYGSFAWLRDFIADPTAERFYRDTNDRMPAYAPHPDDPTMNQITAQELALIVRWLRGDERNLE